MGLHFNSHACTRTPLPFHCGFPLPHAGTSHGERHDNLNHQPNAASATTPAAHPNSAPNAAKSTKLASGTTCIIVFVMCHRVAALRHPVRYASSADHATTSYPNSPQQPRLCATSRSLPTSPLHLHEHSSQCRHARGVFTNSPTTRSSPASRRLAFPRARPVPLRPRARPQV